MEYVTTACCFLPRAVKQPTHFCWIMSSFATSRPPPYRCLNGSFLGFPQRALRLQNFAIQHSYSNYGRMKTLRAVTPVGLSTESMSEKRAQEEPSAVLSGDCCSEPLAIVLDIEGTTTPISFVMDVLFPYARDNVRSHLELTYDSEETQDDINLLRKQAEEDVEAGVIGVQSIPPSNASKNEIIAAAEANVISMIKADRKVTALKELQGHIWRSGFMKGEIKGQVFDDVPKALSKWQSAGQKAYIYSSGSREAQRLIFGNTQYGDLRPFLCGYFDTYIGNKREVRSYKEIFLSLGVDKPSQIVFATDVLQEAIAAKQAGLKAVLVLRPGNAPLPEEHGFQTVTELLQI